MVLLVAAILMTIFFLAGLYVATALGLIGMSLMQIFSDRPLWDMLGQIAWNTNSSFILVAVPLFILNGRNPRAQRDCQPHVPHSIGLVSPHSGRPVALQHCLMRTVRRRLRL